MKCKVGAEGGKCHEKRGEKVMEGMESWGVKEKGATGNGMGEGGRGGGGWDIEEIGKGGVMVSITPSFVHKTNS